MKTFKAKNSLLSIPIPGMEPYIVSSPEYLLSTLFARPVSMNYVTNSDKDIKFISLCRLI